MDRGLFACRFAGSLSAADLRQHIGEFGDAAPNARVIAGLAGSKQSPLCTALATPGGMASAWPCSWVPGLASPARSASVPALPAEVGSAGRSGAAGNEVWPRPEPDEERTRPDGGSPRAPPRSLPGARRDTGSTMPRHGASSTGHLRTAQPLDRHSGEDARTRPLRVQPHRGSLVSWLRGRSARLGRELIMSGSPRRALILIRPAGHGGSPPRTRPSTLPGCYRCGPSRGRAG